MMASFWQRIKDELFLQSPNAPTMGGYPKSYAAGLGDAVGRTQIFDPALKQYSRAFRLGDPNFSDPGVARKWRACRDDVVHHVLGIAMEPPWETHLVLRGSLLLMAWLGEEARQPGDLDFVFRPRAAGMDDRSSEELLVGLVGALAHRPEAGAATIEVDRVAIDDIWTYERAPGRRLVFPWRAEGAPPGRVQLDIVFGEELWEEPARALIPHPSGFFTPAWSATPAVSLAWKLLWLESDMHPQGKDLYDATLLAERTGLPFDLLSSVLKAGECQLNRLEPNFPTRWEVDWANFLAECPWVEGEARDWQERLTRALAPTFESR